MKTMIKQDQPADWLIVFLILEAIDIQVSVDEMFKEVKDIKLKKENKIYVLQDSIQHIKDPLNINYELSINELVYNEQTNATALTPVQLKGVKPGEGYAWRDALRQIMVENESRVSALITWSHGAGIGIAKASIEPGDPAVSLDVVRNKINLVRNFPNPDREFIKGHFNCKTLGTTNDTLVVNNTLDEVPCSELQDLFISEIAEGLSDMATPVFDIMVMGNCNTQIIDNCYNLNKVAKFYLAPITLIETNGYDFSGFIKTINDGIPDNNPANQYGSKKPPIKGDKNYKPYFTDIAKLFLNGYIRLNESLEKSAAIVVNDLEHILELGPMLNEVCTYFMDNRAVVYPVIDKVLKIDTITFTDKDFIDVVLLFDTIQKNLKDPVEFNGIYSKLRDFLLNNISVEKHIGEELDKDSFHCFSIYIPVTIDNSIAQTFCCQYFREFANSQFVKETSWDDFIIDFTIWRIRNKVATAKAQGAVAISKLESINLLRKEARSVHSK